MTSAPTYSVPPCRSRYSALGLAPLLFAFLVGACSQSIGGEFVEPAQDAEGADAGVPDPITTEPDASVPVTPQLEDISLRATPSDSIAPLNSISCNRGDPDFIHADNRYFRVYDLALAGIQNDLEVTSVDVGIEQALGAGGAQNVVVSLHLLTGPIETGTLEELAVTSVNVVDQNETILNVPMSVTVPGGSSLVVEVFTPDGEALGNKFFIGSNREIETSPSYIVASICGIDTPTPIADLGVAGVVMSMVLNVNGQHLVTP